MMKTPMLIVPVHRGKKVTLAPLEYAVQWAMQDLLEHKEKD